VPSTFVEALKVVRTGGVVVEAGAFVDMGPVQIDPNSDISTRNVAVLGLGGSSHGVRTVHAPDGGAPGSLPPHQHHFAHPPLDRAQEAVILAQSGEAMQVALDPRMPLAT